MLLSRVADRIYWAARYIERAEDTARIVLNHGYLTADLPGAAAAPWEPLVAIMGSGSQFLLATNGEQQQQQQQQPSTAASASELAVAQFLVTDARNSSSVVSCVGKSRENLRTTRDTVPAEGWNTVNDLYLYLATEADRGVDRRVRQRVLSRVIADSRRLDGVLAVAMTHDEAYVMWRLGRAIERADMTTRVLGVRAAAVLSLGADLANGPEQPELHDEVQWMGVLRSVSGLQMYQRAVRQPIEGPLVVQFLLENDRFPRSVRALLREIRRALRELVDPDGPLDAVDEVEAVLRRSSMETTDAAEGAAGSRLDDAMDALQVAIDRLDRRIAERYLRVGA
jgi:uncharacterized alpha-E superfamily protein